MVSSSIGQETSLQPDWPHRESRTDLVSAIASRVLLVAPMQKQPRLFITLFVQVMEKGRVSARWELASELVNAGKQGQKVGFRIGSSHGFHCLVQFRQRDQDVLLNCTHDHLIMQFWLSTKLFVLDWPARRVRAAPGLNDDPRPPPDELRLIVPSPSRHGLRLDGVVKCGCMAA